MYLFMLHVTLLIGKLMSQFQEKVFAACAKKKLSLTKALVAMPYVLCLPAFYLTMSTSVGIIGADIIGAASPALSRFVFAFIFAIQIGLRSHFQRRVSHFKT